MKLDRGIFLIFFSFLFYFIYFSRLKKSETGRGDWGTGGRVNPPLSSVFLFNTPSEKHLQKNVTLYDGEVYTVIYIVDL